MTEGSASSLTLPAAAGPCPADELATTQPPLGADVWRLPRSSLSIDVGEVDVHLASREAVMHPVGENKGSRDADEPCLSERSNDSSAGASACISSARLLAHMDAKLSQARRAEAATQESMETQLMETQAEMLRIMMARLQEQYVELATGVDRIRNAIGLPMAPDTPLSTSEDGAAASDSSEEDIDTFGL